jgi:prophage regulatory protein
MEIALQRLPTLCARLGLTRPTIYKKIGAGLLPRPVKVGDVSVWPSNETDAVIAAQIRGASDDELRQIVADLVAARTSAGTTGEAV